jgi:hypothetical protein
MPTILWQNEWKVVAHARVKAALEWDHLKEATQGNEKVPKPPLVKLISKNLVEDFGHF